MRTSFAEPITALVLLLLAGFGWWNTLSIPSQAALFPRLVLSLLSIFSVIYLIRSVVSQRQTAPIFAHRGRFAASLLLTFVYLAVFPVIGYFTASLLFIPAFAVSVGFRRPLFIAVSTALYIAVVYVLFVVVFERRLPEEFLLMLFR